MGIDVTRVQAVCFDIDGTLSDTDDLWAERIASRLQPFRRVIRGGDTIGFARWLLMGMEAPGNLMYHWLDHAGLDKWIGKAYNLWAQHGINRRPGAYLAVPEIQTCLMDLSQHYPLAVVSARDRRGTTAFLDQYDLLPLFKIIVTANTCQHTKPFPDPVVWAAEKMGVLPQNCLMVGDSTVDILAGKAAGAQTVGVLCGFGAESELRRAGADLILPSTNLLKQVLLQ